LATPFRKGFSIHKWNFAILLINWHFWRIQASTLLAIGARWDYSTRVSTWLSFGGGKRCLDRSFVNIPFS
jgi:hypothetical protein